MPLPTFGNHALAQTEGAQAQQWIEDIPVAEMKLYFEQFKQTY